MFTTAHDFETEFYQLLAQDRGVTLLDDLVATAVADDFSIAELIRQVSAHQELHGYTLGDFLRDVCRRRGWSVPAFLARSVLEMEQPATSAALPVTPEQPAVSAAAADRTSGPARRLSPLEERVLAALRERQTWTRHDESLREQVRGSMKEVRAALNRLNWLGFVERTGNTNRAQYRLHR